MIAELGPYPSYKKTGLPWLTSMPSHWRLVPNRAFLRKRKVLVGQRHSEYKLLSLTKQGVIVRDLSSGRGKFSADMGSSQEVRSGDLVFCLFDVPETPRTIGLSSHNGMITGAYTVFECPDITMAKYIEKYYISMDDRKLLSPLYSGLRNTIPPARFLGTRTPVPTSDEQAAIVRFLDHVDRKIRRFIHAKRRLIELLDEQKQAVINHAVARGLTPNTTFKPSGISWLGDIPAHWELVPNKALLKLDKRVVGSNADQYTLLSLTKQGIIPRNLDTPEGKFPASFDSYQEVDAGDMVFCLFDVDETPRTVGLASISGMITGAYTRFKCLDSESAQYLLAFYTAMDDGKFLKPLYTGLRKVIPKSVFLNTKIPLPPREERVEIVLHIRNKSREIAAAKERAETELLLIREYRTRLIADVVMGKLDVRESAERLPSELEPDGLEDEALGIEDSEEADDDASESPSDAIDED